MPLPGTELYDILTDKDITLQRVAEVGLDVLDVEVSAMRKNIKWSGSMRF